MTYCLGIITNSGLIMAADSRTNAGVDNVSTYQKLFDFSQSGERVILLCTSGNLSLTQAVMMWLRKELKLQETVNLHTCNSLYEVACYIGGKIRQVQEQDGAWLQQNGIDFNCSFLLGGQVQGEDPELYLIYKEGNFIQATAETPFLQIGETKYGKPILDRTLSYQMPLEAAVKCALVSIDSTMRSNISVGPPINLVMYEANTFIIRHQLQLNLEDPYLTQMRSLWEDSLKQAFERIPNINWQQHFEGQQTIQ